MKKLKKIAKHTSRTILILMMLFVIFLGGFYYVINSSWGERLMAKELSSQLTKILGDSVVVGHLDVQLPNVVVLKDVVMFDHHKNQMFRLDHIFARVGYFSSISNRLTISQVDLEGVKWDLHRYKGEDSSNFGYVLNRLQSSDTTQSKNPFKIQFRHVKIGGLNFLWNDENFGRDTTMIDWHHLAIDHVNGIFTDLNIVGSDVSAKIKQLSFKEQSGFVLSDLRTNFTYTDTSMEFDYFSLRTPHTYVTDYLRFDYKDVKDFTDFVNKVQMTSELDNSYASFKDIAFFTQQLINKQDVININSATVNGTLANMRVRGLNASFGVYSFIDGKVSLRGLPNINETFIDAQIRAAATSKEELMRYFPELELPKETGKLGKIRAVGEFTGFLRDFVAYGTINTDLGKIITDVNLKLPQQKSMAEYSGNIELQGFNIGKYLGNPNLGITTGKGKLSGKGLVFSSMSAQMEGKFDRFDFNGYSYQNLKVDGKLSSRFFNGRFDAADPNLKLNFSGAIDFSGEKPAYDFIAHVDNANLRALNFTKDSITISCLLNIDAKGSNLDDVEGFIAAFNAKIENGHQNYYLDSVEVRSLIIDSFRTLHLTSDLLTANISGRFTPTELPDVFKNTWNQYTDAGMLRFETRPVNYGNLYFDVQFRNMLPIFNLLNSDITLHDSGYIKGHIAEGGKSLSISTLLPGIRYENYRANRLELNGHTENGNLEFDVSADQFYIKDSMMARDIKIAATTGNEGLEIRVNATDEEKFKRIDIGGHIEVGDKMAVIILDTSYLQVKDTIWTIVAKPMTIYEDTLIEFPLISIAYKNEGLKIIGKYSANYSYPIRAVMENLDLHHATAFIPGFKELGGKLNGQALINNINDKPIIEAAVFANPFTFSGDTLGYMRLTANFDQSTNLLSIDGSVLSGINENVISTEGYIAFDKSQKINIDVSLHKTDIKIFEPFVDGIFSHLTGTSTADLVIGGTLDKPEVHGKVYLEKAALVVDYLQTRYHFDDTVDLNGKAAEFNHLKVYDDNGNVAEVTGKLDMSDFSKLGLDLQIDAKNFQVLNTTQKDNELYYGTAYGTGFVTIKGDVKNLAMYIKMKTEKNTVFSMPLSEGSSFTGYNFIHFTNTHKFLKDEKSVNLNGLTLSMDLEVTPDAVAQIIFDPRVGDIIEARGHGDLRMDITTEGDFNMYGTYTIDNGKYLFTALNVINKYFTITPGSSLNWQGSPYQALMNVKAVYSLRTSILPLLPAELRDDPTDQQYYSRSMPVDAELFLTGPLLFPNVKLDFEVQDMGTVQGTAQNILASQIRSIKANEQEATRQVASLLVFNQFLTPNEGVGAAEISSGWTSNVGDLISNQLNYILSKVIPDLQVGFDLKKNEEMTMKVSKDFNNQKANVSLSYDFYKSNYNVQGSYKLSEDGGTRVNVFSRSNNELQIQTINTTGVGIYRRKEFDKISDLFKRKPKKETTKQSAPMEKPAKEEEIGTPKNL